jgi:ketosteroid isomerase-like protein
MRHALFLAMVSCSHPAAPAAPAVDSDDVRAIRAVLEDFRAAIAAKDGKTLEHVILRGDIPFVSRAVAPSSAVNVSTATDFALALSTSKTTWEEKFADVHITADGVLGLLDAHYEFYDGGKLTNDGREIWGLVRTPDGWKITSVSWSIHPR